MDTTQYLIIQISFVVLTLISTGWFVKEIFAGIAASSFASDRKKKMRFGIITGLFLWLIFVSALSISGFLSDFTAFPPRLMIVLVIPLITVLVITFSSSLKEIVQHIPVQNLVRLQVFRVPVEILLWMLFLENLLPEQMTFEGRNFDVLAGVTGPLAAYFLRNNRKAMIVWNILGLATLINIVTVAILSMPTSFRYFMEEPANTIVTYFPVVLLPAFLVTLAYTLHFFSLRQLLTR